MIEETDGSVTCRGSDEENEHYAEHKAPVADAVCDEGLLGRVSGFLAVDVITNQQIRAETDTFPTHKHQQEVVGQHQRQHRKHEQVQKRKEAIEPAVFMHVPNREDMYEEPDKRNEERVGAAQPVHCQTEVCAKLANLNPGPEMIENRLG